MSSGRAIEVVGGVDSGSVHFPRYSHFLDEVRVPGIQLEGLPTDLPRTVQVALLLVRRSQVVENAEGIGMLIQEGLVDGDFPFDCGWLASTAPRLHPECTVENKPKYDSGGMCRTHSWVFPSETVHIFRARRFYRRRRSFGRLQSW